MKGKFIHVRPKLAKLLKLEDISDSSVSGVVKFVKSTPVMNALL